MTEHTALATADIDFQADFARLISATLVKEQSAAERTLGRHLVDPALFAFNCLVHGLGFALNTEQDLVDLLDAADVANAQRFHHLST